MAIFTAIVLEIGASIFIKIESETLAEDSNDIYPSTNKPYEGNYITLPASQYNEVKDLLEKFPEQLLHEKDTVLGTPDAGDWGGYYIEVRRNNKIQFWLIDKMRSNIPAYLNPFLDDVEAKLKLFN